MPLLASLLFAATCASLWIIIVFYGGNIKSLLLYQYRPFEHAQQAAYVTDGYHALVACPVSSVGSGGRSCLAPSNGLTRRFLVNLPARHTGKGATTTLHKGNAFVGAGTGRSSMPRERREPRERRKRR
eukprot:7905558-Pyramimonas_sp.AAC.1